MKPWTVVERVLAPEGTEMTLVERDGEYVVRYDGKVLMSTRQHASEEALATLALEGMEAPKCVLVGGMGLGYTARAALDRLPRDGKLVIAEYTPALVEWNRKHVGAFARRPLDDRRTKIHLGDAVALIYSSNALYDAILLDIDNGPSAMVHAENQRLYGDRGIAACRAALRPNGVLAVWSSDPDPPYLKRLERAGFTAHAKPIAARGKYGGVRHVIFVAVRQEPRGPKRWGKDQSPPTPSPTPVLPKNPKGKFRRRLPRGSVRGGRRP